MPHCREKHLAQVCDEDLLTAVIYPSAPLLHSSDAAVEFVHCAKAEVINAGR